MEDADFTLDHRGRDGKILGGDGDDADRRIPEAGHEPEEGAIADGAGWLRHETDPEEIVLWSNWNVRVLKWEGSGFRGKPLALLSVPQGDCINSVAIRDLDGDGKPEILVGGRFPSKARNQDPNGWLEIYTCSAGKQRLVLMCQVGPWDAIPSRNAYAIQAANLGNQSGNGGGTEFGIFEDKDGTVFEGPLNSSTVTISRLELRLLPEAGPP